MSETNDSGCEQCIGSILLLLAILLIFVSLDEGGNYLSPILGIEHTDSIYIMFMGFSTLMQGLVFMNRQDNWFIESIVSIIMGITYCTPMILGLGGLRVAIIGSIFLIYGIYVLVKGLKQRVSKPVIDIQSLQ